MLSNINCYSPNVLKFEFWTFTIKRGLRKFNRCPNHLICSFLSIFKYAGYNVSQVLWGGWVWRLPYARYLTIKINIMKMLWAWHISAPLVLFILYSLFILEQRCLLRNHWKYQNLFPKSKNIKFISLLGNVKIKKINYVCILFRVGHRGNNHH